MEYYVKSVVPIIKMNYDNFTAVEKSIADFFIQNQEKVELSSKAMADRLFVSEASLSRFAQNAVIGATGSLSTSMRPPLWKKMKP